MAKLSTHVLDTARGNPGKNIKIELYSVANGNRKHLKSATTNDDGRTDEPLLEGAEVVSGTYELDFHLSPYFEDLGGDFLDVVTVRFKMREGESYHVPLLASPFGYTTYRGS